MDLSRLLVSEVRSALDLLERGECGLSPHEAERAFRTIQYYKEGRSHFDELTARSCIAQIFYYVDDSTKVFAPYFDFARVKELYAKVAADILDYNFWDFAVTLNLSYAKHHDLIKKWTRGQEKLEERLCQLSVKFLNDDLPLHPEGKIWWYING